jgi:hypothetical protein
MKKHLFFVAAAFVTMAAFTSCSEVDNPGTPTGQIRVLTFEDSDWKAGKNYIGQQSWTSLIDNPQYGGALLYPEDDEATIYQWAD